jgi:hypothetical protein
VLARRKKLLTYLYKHDRCGVRWVRGWVLWGGGGRGGGAARLVRSLVAAWQGSSRTPCTAGAQPCCAAGWQRLGVPGTAV